MAFERPVVRLEAVAPGRWLVKGAYALDVRLGVRYRTRMAVDIEWQANANEAREALLDASAYDAGDYFVFKIERMPLVEDRSGGSVRFDVLASPALRHEFSGLLVGDRVSSGCSRGCPS